jgi:hypothetical protein
MFYPLCCAVIDVSMICLLYIGDRSELGTLKFLWNSSSPCYHDQCTACTISIEVFDFLSYMAIS